MIESTRISAAELFQPEVGKYPVQDLFVDAIEVDLAALVDQPHAKHPAAKLLLAPTAIEQIILLRIGLLIGAAGLLDEIVQAPLKTGQSKIIALSFVAETIRCRRFFAHRSAKIEGNDEEKNKYPKHQISTTPR